MEKFLAEAATPYWWLSVAVVGVLTSIFSAYLLRWLDRLFSTLSDKWQNRSETARARFTGEVLRLAESESLRAEYWRDEVRLRFKAMVMLAASVLGYLLAYQHKLSAAPFVKYWEDIVGATSLVAFYLGVQLIVVAEERAKKLKAAMHHMEKRREVDG